MADQVFTYRTPRWTLPWVISGSIAFVCAAYVVFQFVTGKVDSGTGDVSPSRHQLTLAAIATAGICLFVLALYFFLAWLNEKIIVKDAEIIWVDETGGTKIRSTRSDVDWFENVAGIPDRIRTANGTIAIRSGLSEMSELRNILSRPLRETTGLSASMEPLPKPNTYTFRFSWVQLLYFALIVAGICLSTLLPLARQPHAIRHFSFWRDEFPTLIGLIVITFGGTVSSFCERITISVDGLLYIDSMGRVKVDVPLSEVQGIGPLRKRTWADGFGGAPLAIYTRRGMVPIRKLLPHAKELIADIKRIGESNSPS